MISCPKCQAANPDGANFCKSCGETIPKSEKKLRCKNGHIMDPSWKVCPHCQAGVEEGFYSGGASNQRYRFDISYPLETTPVSD